MKPHPSSCTNRLLPLALGIAAMGGCQNNQPIALFQDKNTEEWTILCREFQGKDHRRNCEQVAEALRATPDITGRHVRCAHIDNQQRSRLYYGRYSRRLDPQSNELTRSDALVNDLKMLHNLADDQGRRYFALARMVRSVEPYEGPDQWLLTSAPGKYSLQVAIFYPEGNFKESQKAAVQYAEVLRKEGHEAYYFHGEVASIVCVGSFEEDAFIERPDGSQEYAPEVKALQRQKEFRYNYVNGRLETKIIQGQRIEPESFLVKIPHEMMQQEVGDAPW